MKLIASNTIKVKGKYVSPGTEFEIDDTAGADLVASGAAAKRMREVPDDESVDGRQSGATTAPDPARVTGQPAAMTSPSPAAGRR